MAKKTSAKRSPAKRQAKAAGAKGGGAARPRAEGGKGAADALMKLLESPLVAELLAVGASAALAALAADRFGRSEDARGTRRALKSAVKSAATAMGGRIAEEFDDIKQSAKKARPTV